MDIEKIKQIAEETGMGMCMYGPLRLVKTDKDTLKFVPDPNLTMYGEKLVAFANAIEKKSKLAMMRILFFGVIVGVIIAY